MELAAFQLTSGIGAVISIVVLGTIFLFWLVSLFLLVGDSISLGAKILWFIALTCLAPFAIPLYFLARSRRSQPAPAR
jgi:uncharacterized membrane protein YbhN (UPF0104 family)